MLEQSFQLPSSERSEEAANWKSSIELMKVALGAREASGWSGGQPIQNGLSAARTARQAPLRFRPRPLSVGPRSERDAGRAVAKGCSRSTALGSACLYVQVTSIAGDPGVKARLMKKVALGY